MVSSLNVAALSLCSCTVLMSVLAIYFVLYSVSGGKCSHVCPNKVCLPKSSVCDGIIDCKDRSDEVNCTRACE